MSQTELGQAVGLTFQQVQKYEKGLTRIGASRLYEFATILRVPVTHFFEGLESARAPRRKTRKAGAGQEAQLTIDTSPETLKLVRAYYKIREPHKRDAIRGLIAGLR